MSLINEALKKAQRSRNADQGEVAPVSGGTTRIAKRGQPLSAKSIVLYAAGALVLFVLAVVGTVVVLNRPTAPATVAAAKPTTTAANQATDGKAPAIVAPVVTAPATPPATETPPAAVAEKHTETAPVAAKKTPPAPESGSMPSAEKAPEPVAAKPTTPAATAATPPPAPAPAAPPAPPAPDDKITAYLDELRITAVRLQGNDSRVMINERVFRLNDIVERRLGLRLTKVETNQLIFTDVNGVTYVKYF